MKAKLDLEEQRVTDVKNREARIQQIMSKMGDIIKGDKDFVLQK